MKFLWIAFLLCISVPAADAQWHWQSLHSAKIDSCFYRVSAIASRAQNVLVFGFKRSHNQSDRALFLRSSNSGESWEEIPLMEDVLDRNGAVMQYIDSSTIVVAVERQILRSTDAGVHWTVESAGDQYNHMVHFANRDEGILSNFLNNTIYITSTGGLSWQSPHGPSLPEAIRAYGNGKYRIASGVRVFTTNDSWNTYTRTYLSTLPSPVGDTVLDGGLLQLTGQDTIFEIVSRRVSNSSKNFISIFRSIDTGRSWSDLRPAPELPGLPDCVTSFESDNIALASPWLVIRSSDHGNSWRSDTTIWDTIVSNPTNDSLSFKVATVLPSGSIIAAVPVITDTIDQTPISGSILVRLAPPTNGVPDVVQGASSIYPNPCSDFVILNLFEVESKISICDAIGNTVAQFQTNQGRSIRWDTHSVPNGTYFAQYNGMDGPHVLTILVAH